jgi:hypothetical protein
MHKREMKYSNFEDCVTLLRRLPQADEETLFTTIFNLQIPSSVHEAMSEIINEKE